jgi:hypothetical protein
MAAVPGWDAERYQWQFGLVSAMAGGVVELLDAAPGEVVLDPLAGGPAGRWFADCWRLRFVAVAEAPGAGPT